MDLLQAVWIKKQIKGTCYCCANTRRTYVVGARVRNEECRYNVKPGINLNGTNKKIKELIKDVRRIFTGFNQSVKLKDTPRHEAHVRKNCQPLPRLLIIYLLDYTALTCQMVDKPPAGGDKLIKRMEKKDTYCIVWGQRW